MHLSFPSLGKGGEMIKSLSVCLPKMMSQEVYKYPIKCVLLFCEQERSGCKLQMIQDGEYLTAPQKPLKIIGEREACQVHA